MKLVLLYTILAGLVALITSPIPGTSLLLTGLEVFMLVHLAKRNKFQLSFKEIGFSAAALWGISSVLKDAVLELLKFFPVLGWAASVIVAAGFIFFLGNLANLYFKR